MKIIARVVGYVGRKERRRAPNKPNANTVTKTVKSQTLINATVRER